MGTEGIILAAGFSSRAKGYKMTLPFGNKTVIETVICNMKKFCSHIVVVGGYKIEKLKPIVSKYKDVELVFNEKYEEGMFSSVKKGFSKVKADNVFFTPGDYPLIDEDVYIELLETKGEVRIPTYKNRKGHPILLESNVIKDVFNSEYNNLRQVINNRKVTFVEVECKGILMDIDTRDDYKRVLEITS